MERLTRRLLLGWALYGALTLATVLLLLWYRGVFLPCRSSRTAQAELGGRPCTLTLENGAFAVQDGKTELWRSEAALRVQDFLTLDIDRDAETELVLLVWRRGNYGPSKPFWVKRNDTSWSQHIFIYNRQGDTFVPQWMSSQLRPKVARWAVQGTDTLFILTPEATETLWQWGQWGLVRTG